MVAATMLRMLPEPPPVSDSANAALELLHKGEAVTQSARIAYWAHVESFNITVESYSSSRFARSSKYLALNNCMNC